METLFRKIFPEGNPNDLLCSDLLAKNEKFFVSKLGQVNGKKIFSNIRGKGTEKSDRVEVNKPRKSVSAEESFQIDARQIGQSQSEPNLKPCLRSIMEYDSKTG